MSNTYWSIKHVESMLDLPDTLTRGRAYFVDDERVIVIDHGRGPVVYGGKAGPQGIAGDPLPQLQEQADYLAAASFSLQGLIYELHQKHKTETARLDSALEAETQRAADALAAETARLDSALESEVQRLEENLQSTREIHERDVQVINSHYSLEIANVKQTAEENLQAIQTELTERFEFLTELSSQNAAAVLTLNLMLKDQFAKYDGMFTALTKSIMGLYPLDNDTATELDVLSAGDRIISDGQTWTVSSYQTDENGMITFTLSQ